MELTVEEQMILRMKRAGVTHRQVASELGLLPPAMSRYLRGAVKMPEDFPTLFQAALERAAAKEAERMRAEADEKGRKLIESAHGVAA